MTKKRRWSLVVAAMVASLTLGGLVTLTTPAGAALGINWGNIWKTKLQPKADKRYYKKTVANKKFAPKPKVIRGVFAIRSAGGTGDNLGDSIAFGDTLGAAPTPHLLGVGDPLPTGCSGTVASPSAAPGHLCVFVSLNNNVSSPEIFSPTGISGSASPFGAYIGGQVASAGNSWLYGSWAVGVDKIVKTRPVPPAKVGGSPDGS